MKNALTKNLARHRAAIRITEESDCLALVNSEETGRISMPEFGDAVRTPAPVAVEGSSAVPRSDFIGHEKRAHQKPGLEGALAGLDASPVDRLGALLGARHRAAIGITEEAAVVEGSSAVPQSGFHQP